MSKLEGEFTSYMKRVVQNAKVDYMRRNANRKKEVLMPVFKEDADISTSVDVYFESTWEMQFETELLEGAFLELPPLKRRVLTYTFVDCLSAETIATILECSVDNVYTLRSRAINHIRSVINKEAGEDEINRLRQNVRKGDSR